MHRYGFLRQAALAACGLLLSMGCGDGNELRDLRRRAAGGEAEALYQLGRLYLEDEERAYLWLSRATDPVASPRPERQLIGVVPPDDGRAFALFHLAAEQGHIEATFQLGVLYLAGRGAVSDPFQAYLAFGRVARLARGELKAKAEGGMEQASGLLSDYQVDEAQGILREGRTPVR